MYGIMYFFLFNKNIHWSLFLHQNIGPTQEKLSSYATEYRTHSNILYEHDYYDGYE